jgi:hypothetical protein
MKGENYGVIVYTHVSGKVTRVRLLYEGIRAGALLTDQALGEYREGLGQGGVRRLGVCGGMSLV